MSGSIQQKSFWRSKCVLILKSKLSWAVMLLSLFLWVGLTMGQPPPEGCTKGKNTIKHNPLLGMPWKPASWEGKILKRHRAGPYSYLRVQIAKQSPQWVVVIGKGLGQKQAVSVKTYGSKRPFYSKRLKRCFPILHFGSVRPRNTKL